MVSLGNLPMLLALLCLMSAAVLSEGQLGNSADSALRYVLGNNSFE